MHSLRGHCSCREGAWFLLNLVTELSTICKHNEWAGLKTTEAGQVPEGERLLGPDNVCRKLPRGGGVGSDSLSCDGASMSEKPGLCTSRMLEALQRTVLKEATRLRL